MLRAVEENVALGAALGILMLRAEDERLDGRSLRLCGKRCLSFSSCSYLGLELDDRLIEGSIDATRRYGTQFSSSRTYVSAPLYAELEELLERIFVGPVLLAPSTTLAHLSALPVLVGERDAVLLDQQVHESVQTVALQLAVRGTRLERVRHSRPDLIDARVRELASRHERVWYCCDGVYSMLGDFAPIPELAGLLQAHPQLCLYVDDAHGIGWFGSSGSGTVLDRLSERERVYVAASLNKSFGAAGGAIVFPNVQERDLVRLRGGPTRYSGPIQPPMLGAALASARIHLSDELPQLQRELAERICLRNRLSSELGLPLVSNDLGPLSYIELGSPALAQQLVEALLESGVYTNVASFPAVPARRAGVRFALTRHHSSSDIQRLLELAAAHLGQLKDEGSGAHRQGCRRVSWSCQHETTVEKIDRAEWDGLMGCRVCFDSKGLASLESVFSNGERPEDHWDFHYYVVRDPNGAPVVAAHATAALWKDDMLAPADVSAEVERARARDPYHQTSKVLATGTLLSEGDHLYIDRTRDWRRGLRLLFDELDAEAQLCGARMVVLRDLPADDGELDHEFQTAGYSRIELAEAMNLEVDWQDRDEYLAGLSYRARKFQRRRVHPFNDTFDVEVVGPRARSPSTEELSRLRQLYRNVKDRSLVLNTFALPEAFLPRIVCSPGWELLLLRLRHGAEAESRLPCGFVACYRHGSVYAPRVIGLDYDLVRSHGLYRQCLRHFVLRAEELGCRRVLFGMGAKYEKSRFGARADRRSVYLRQVGAPPALQAG